MSPLIFPDIDHREFLQSRTPNYENTWTYPRSLSVCMTQPSSWPSSMRMSCNVLGLIPLSVGGHLPKTMPIGPTGSCRMVPHVKYLCGRFPNVRRVNGCCAQRAGRSSHACPMGHFILSRRTSLLLMKQVRKLCPQRCRNRCGTPSPVSSGPSRRGPGRPDRGSKESSAKTDRAIVGLFFLGEGDLLESGQFLYRNDNFFMLLASEPEKAHDFLDQFIEIHLVNLRRFLGAVGSNIDIILFDDALGMQTGPLHKHVCFKNDSAT